MEHFGDAVSDEEIRRIFDAVDYNKTNNIDYSEFIVAAMQRRQLNSQDKLQAAFHIFDRDGSGIISEDDIRSVLQFSESDQQSSEALKALLKQVDENNEGEMSFEEFFVMMRSVE